MQAALEKELEEVEAGATKETDGDAEMAGAETKKEDDEVSEAGSEDLEQESSDDDDDEEEEGEGEGDGDEDMEMAEGGEEKPAEGAQPQTNGEKGKPEVMVH